MSEETPQPPSGPAAGNNPTPPSGPAGASTPPSGPAGGPPSGPRGGPGGPPSGPSGPAGDRDRPPRRDDRGDRGDRPERPARAPLTVKGRLRAAARKKARKQAKRKGGMFQRRKVCRFCADKNLTISYKDVKTLRLFITETGKMTPRRISGTCAKHQRQLAIEIKRARQLAMLPMAPSHF